MKCLHCDGSGYYDTPEEPCPSCRPEEYKEKHLKPTWKEIFNTSAGKGKWWGYIGNAHAYATEGGYLYFSWNGWIYDSECDKTEWTVDMIAEADKK